MTMPNGLGQEQAYGIIQGIWYLISVGVYDEWNNEQKGVQLGVCDGRVYAQVFDSLVDAAARMILEDELEEKPGPLAPREPHIM